MIWINALNSNNTKIGKNQRYVVITSKSALSNYGGAFIITNDFGYNVEVKIRCKYIIEF